MKISKLHWLSALALSGALLTACQHEPAKKAVPTVSPAAAAINNAVIQKSPNDDRTYAAVVLANNLQVVLVSDPGLVNSAASLAVGVGSAQDPQEHQGLAHYLEHMLFLGTKKFPEPDGFMKFTQANGGMTNAFTAFDKTNFLFQVNSNKFDEALDRFSDYFKSPTFDPHYSDKERAAVNNEWSMQKQQDGWIMNRVDAITGNPQSPRAKFNIGNLETLVDAPNSKLNEAMKNFYQQYYSSNIMRLTLVGKQSIPELKMLAEKYFADIPNKNVVRPEVTIPGLTDAEKSKNIYYKPNKDFKALYVDFPVKSNKDQWRLKPNEYVRNLLTTEEAGTLCEQLRKKGLAVNTTAYFASEAYGADGYMRVQVELSDLGLKHQDEVIAAIFSYIDLVKREGLNENYFRELQAMRSKDFLNAGKPNPLQQAVQLTTLQFDIPVENLLNAGFVYERYDEKAIKDVLDQLDTQKVRIWHVSQQEKVSKPISYFDGNYDIQNIPPEKYAQLAVLAKKYTFNLPPLNNLFTDKPAPIVESKYLRPHEVVSSAGIEAFLQHAEFYREDKGQISLEINSGLGIKNAKNVVLASLLSEIYKKQNTSLMDRAHNASLGIFLSTGGPGSQSIYVSGYTTKHSVLIEELLKNFAKLEFVQSEFDEALVSYKQGLANKDKDHVYRQLFGHLGRLTNKVQWRDSEYLAAAEKITLKDVIAYYNGVKRDPLIRILAVGNYSEEAVKQMAASATKILPGKRLPKDRIISQYTTPSSGKVIELKESVNLADNGLMLGWFRDKKSDDEQAQLVILNAFLDKAFFAQLRTQDQLGYVVQSMPYAVDEVPGYVMMVQSSNTDLVKIKARIDKFRQDYLAELKAIDPAAIEATKKATIENIMQKPTDFYKEAGLYVGEFWHAKYAFDARDRHLTALKMVTKEDLIKIYEDMLMNDKSSGILLQTRGTNFKDSPFVATTP
ncbi:pitrilysin [Cellvibrio zantedeschiae]|uniref:Protease 3 n=1 Tax=Cellvibrio zantedeschiae TaxID=1237077 RepID=A0ABQ3B635_9GAMM|nr:insulinase family protein [Cellvibrio zantedeschiae]GGY77325.1 pitrilysin [Cellvibrio zantedeschiae]